jgi:hypothetical protein
MKGILLIICFLMIIGFSRLSIAEGAWVLWEKWHYPDSTKKGVKKYINTDWHLSNAYPNYEMCIKKRDAAINGFKSNWDASQIISSENMVRVKGESLPSGGFVVEFSYEGKCLPDTIDPRK